MRKIILAVLLIVSLYSVGICQEPKPSQKEVEVDQIILVDLAKAKEVIPSLEKQIKALEDVIAAHGTITELQKAQIEEYKKLVEAKKELDSLYQNMLTIKAEESKILREENARLYQENVKLRESKSKKAFLYALLGVATGVMLTR